MAWWPGNRTGAYKLGRYIRWTVSKTGILISVETSQCEDRGDGHGAVAHGVLEIMNPMGIHEAEPDEYLGGEFSYPVYVHLKGPISCA